MGLQGANTRLNCCHQDRQLHAHINTTRHHHYPQCTSPNINTKNNYSETNNSSTFVQQELDGSPSSDLLLGFTKHIPASQHQKHNTNEEEKASLTLHRCRSHRLRHPWPPPPCRSCLEDRNEKSTSDSNWLCQTALNQFKLLLQTG